MILPLLLAVAYPGAWVFLLAVVFCDLLVKGGGR